MTTQAEAVEGLPAGFKLTEIGPLPQEWELRRFGDIVKETVSGDWGQDKPGDSSELVNCYVVRATDFQRLEQRDLSSIPRRWVKPASITKRQLQAGDLLVELSGGSKDQPTGRVLCVDDAMLAQADRPVTFSNFVKLLRVDEARVDPWFVYRFWTYVYERGAIRVYEKRTTGIRNFKYREFLEHESLPIPPLDEQRAIAGALSTIQQAIEATDRVIATARQFKNSLMRHLFTCGPVPLWEAERVPLKETNIGPVPERWEVVPLGDVMAVVYRYPSYYGIEYVESGVPEVRGELLKANGEIESNLARLRFISTETARRFPRTELQEGDIVISVRGTMGKIGIVRASLAGANITANLMRLSPERHRLNSEFLKYVLLSDAFHTMLNTLSPQTTIKTIQAPLLKSIPIPLPPLSQQEEIAKMLTAVGEKMEAEDKHKAGLRELFRTMLHLLMMGQVRVRN